MESAQDRALNLASAPRGCDTLEERRDRMYAAHRNIVYKYLIMVTTEP